jgi:prevent-host-death family protein
MRGGTYTRVQVAELKARLSEYLRKVQAGEDVVVLSRDTPVAMLVSPPEKTTNLMIRRPGPGIPRLSEIQLPPPPDSTLGVDTVALLGQERQDR